MTQFRKKPVVIEAHQYTRNGLEATYELAEQPKQPAEAKDE